MPNESGTTPTDKMKASSWLDSRAQFERDHPPAPLKTITCDVCGDTKQTRTVVHREGKTMCGVCADAPVALGYERKHSTQP